MRRHVLVAACLAAVAMPAGVAYAATSHQGSQPPAASAGEQGPGAATPLTALAPNAPIAAPQPAPVVRATLAGIGDPVTAPSPPSSEDGPCWDDCNPDAAVTATGTRANDGPTVGSGGEGNRGAAGPSCDEKEVGD